MVIAVSALSDQKFFFGPIMYIALLSDSLIQANSETARCGISSKSQFASFTEANSVHTAIEEESTLGVLYWIRLSGSNDEEHFHQLNYNWTGLSGLEIILFILMKAFMGGDSSGG